MSGTDHSHSSDPCQWALDRIREVVSQGGDPLADTHIATHLRECPPCDQWELTRRVQVLVQRKCGQDRAPSSLAVRIQEMLRVEGSREA